MARKGFLSGLVTILIFGLIVASARAEEKVRFGTHFKMNPQYGLPALTASEKGFWKEQGLEVEYLPFDRSGFMMRALAAKHLDMGTLGLTRLVRSVSRGAPAVLVADPGITTTFFFWVRAGSPRRKPEDIKGAKIGVTGFGGATHTTGVAVARVLGLEKEVKFLAMGGGRAQMAGLKSGAIDIANLSFFTMAGAKAKGEIRALLNADDYLPKGLSAQVIIAHKNLGKQKPGVVKKVIKGFLKGGDFVMKNREWTIEKMKTHTNYSEEAAKIAFPLIRYSTDGKVDKRKIENVRKFFVEYGIMAKEKIAPVEKIYPREFVK